MTLKDKLHAIGQQGTLKTRADILKMAKELNLTPVQNKGIPAAVLIPLIERSGGLTILLTQRTQHLKRHPGQISFPGGRLDPSDVSPQAGALREVREEIGIDQVTILGELGVFSSFSGFEITSILGLIQPPYHFKANEAEVESIFELPLETVLDLKRYKLEHIERDGEKRSFYRLHFEDKNIWGFTGTLLYFLAHCLQDK